MPRKASEELNGVAKLYHCRQLAEKGIAPSDPTFEADYPNLFSLLTNNKVGPDEVIDPPALRVTNSSGDWSASISVTGLQMFGEMLFHTFGEVLPGVERALADGSFPWKCNLKKRAKPRKLELQK